MSNKSAQSNLAKGLRRSAVAHIRPVVPVDNGAPQICSQKYHFPWTNHQTPPFASSLDRLTYDAKRHADWHPDPICRFSTMHLADRQTDRQIVQGKV